MTSIALRGAYTYGDAADYCGCSEQTLRNDVAEGRLAPVFHGTKPVFLRAELDAYLAALPESKGGKR
jgi:excisionase family DNA binding protein